MSAETNGGIHDYRTLMLWLLGAALGIMGVVYTITDKQRQEIIDLRVKVAEQSVRIQYLQERK